MENYPPGIFFKGDKNKYFKNLLPLDTVVLVEFPVAMMSYLLRFWMSGLPMATCTPGNGLPTAPEITSETLVLI